MPKQQPPNRKCTKKCPRHRAGSIKAMIMSDYKLPIARRKELVAALFTPQVAQEAKSNA